MNKLDKQSRIVRDPDETRRRILEAAFEVIYRKGFQGMRLDEVLAGTGLTKGALYHHFPNKQALGYAVVEEVIRPMVESLWVEPLREARDPLATLARVVETLPERSPADMLRYGCPLNNLAQEMSPLDEGFRSRLDALFALWLDATRDALERARRSGRLKPDVDIEDAALFVMAALEGCIGLAKNAQSRERLERCYGGLSAYLRSLAADA